MILFLDTESSGLYRSSLSPSDPSQPHIVQLGFKVIDDKRRRVACHVDLVRPDGWGIEAEAFAVHGISERRAYKGGVPLPDALRNLRIHVPQVKTIVGHGIQNFDRLLISAELHRLGVTGEWWNSRGGDIFDTMEAATPILKMPGEFGPKFPSLEEAHDALCPEFAVSSIGTPWRSSHDALDDCDATERVYFAIQDRLATDARQS